MGFKFAGNDHFSFITFAICSVFLFTYLKNLWESNPGPSFQQAGPLTPEYSAPFLHTGLQHGRMFLVQKTGICSRAKGMKSRMSTHRACGASSNLFSTTSPTGRARCLLYIVQCKSTLEFQTLRNNSQ
jgi:hypothetical protein